MSVGREEQLARILDECEHGSTAAFCAVCKRNNPTAEYIARQRRRADNEAWKTTGFTMTASSGITTTRGMSALPYPFTEAKYAGRCECGDEIQPGDLIWKVEEDWVCGPCADLANALGETR